jgi:hypothetical protein
VAKTPLRIKGHKLTLEWSGERGVEASSTGICICGWEESASNQQECRWEYRHHLGDVHQSILAIEAEKGRYKVYYVSNPNEALGMPGWANWAVSKDGDFIESFRNKMTANGYIEDAMTLWHRGRGDCP